MTKYLHTPKEIAYLYSRLYDLLMDVAIARKIDVTKNILLAIMTLLIIASTIYIVMQRNSREVLDHKLQILGKTTEETSKKNLSLTKENENMKQAILALQQQIKETSKNSNERKSPQDDVASKLTVTNVGHQSITVPANEYHQAIDTDYHAVRVRIINLSKTLQSYSTDNFLATTSGGVVVRPPSFGPGIEQEVWTRSELAPGGEMEITLLFQSAQDLATIALLIPNTSSQLVATLPASP